MDNLSFCSKFVMMRWFTYVVCVGLFAVIEASGQNNNEKLAAQYFAEGEYAKAAELYEDLASDQPQSVYFYENLLQCHILLKDFRSAEKLLEKRIRKFPEMYSYRVDRAWLYSLQEKPSERDRMLKDLTGERILSAEQAEYLANALLKRQFYNHAVQVYLMARKTFDDPYLFAYQLSDVYFYSSRFKEATEELVQIASANLMLIDDVKNKLSIAYKNAEQYRVLISVVLPKIQKEPDNEACNRLLIWGYTQLRDWNGAIVQSKAIDRRTKGQGLYLLELATVLIECEEYEYAMQCYDYVKSLGPDARYFFQARQGILNSGMRQVRAGKNVSGERLLSLEKDYLDYLNSDGINWQTAPQIRDLAELYLYHLHETQKAVEQLSRAVTLPGLNPRLQAACKLDLGDAMLIMGDIWEADLLYKQVEKAFTNDALGQEARFRYARLCYFRGDFAWSQTQLDVLKSATTQLISNNAMMLWLLIQDNTGMDSTEDALKMFAKADLQIFRNNNEQALRILDSIPELFSGHTLTDEIHFAKAQIAEKQQRFKDAEELYTRLISEHSYDILADNALINLARLYDFKTGEPEKALKTYEIIVLQYTGSLFADEARKRYRYLRGDNRETDSN